MNPTIHSLKQLYSTPSPRRAVRAATLAPLVEKARALRAALYEIRIEHEDVAHEAAGLDGRALVRYLAPDLVPVVGRLIEAAKSVKSSGSADETTESVHAALSLVDTPVDRAFEAAVQIVTRNIDRLEGTVRALRSHVSVLQSSLNMLAAAEQLSSSVVNVPKIDDGMIAEESKK